MSNNSQKALFQVHYTDFYTDKTVVVKVREIQDSPLGYTFMQLSDFVFDTNSVVIKPSEEQQKKNLENTKSLHICVHNILAIEELSDVSAALHLSKENSRLFMLPKEKHKPQ